MLEVGAPDARRAPLAAPGPDERLEFALLGPLKDGDECEHLKAYMVQVRRLFHAGASVPVSDVGLISTQEDVNRKPILNHIAAFSNSAVIVYLLVQKAYRKKEGATSPSSKISPCIRLWITTPTFRAIGHL